MKRRAAVAWLTDQQARDEYHQWTTNNITISKSKNPEL